MQFSLHCFNVVDKSKQKQVEISFERRHHERERQGSAVHEGYWWCWMVMKYHMPFHHTLHRHSVRHQFSSTLLPESLFCHFVLFKYLSEIWKQQLLLQLFLTMESPLFMHAYTQCTVYCCVAAKHSEPVVVHILCVVVRMTLWWSFMVHFWLKPQYLPLVCYDCYCQRICTTPLKPTGSWRPSWKLHEI